MDFLIAIIDRLLLVVWILLLIRVVLSWIVVLGGVRNEFLMRLNYAVVVMTEPMLAPIRRMLPQTGAADFSVLIAFVLILFIRLAISRIG